MIGTWKHRLVVLLNNNQLIQRGERGDGERGKKQRRNREQRREVVFYLRKVMVLVWLTFKLFQDEGTQKEGPEMK